MEKTRCYGCMKLKSPGDVCEHCGYDQRQGNAPHQLPAGTVLKEQYLLGKVLGQGGFGITYLGWDLYLDIPVAVKEYYPTGTVMRESSMSMDVVSCGDEASVRFRNNKERFLREAKMLARFSQVPEIVQVRNFFLANNTAYIVMEYVDGITLKQYVRDNGGKLSIEKTLAILNPMIQTMSRIHKAGIVHRDISPDNVMMLPDGTAKLLDFGAVRDVGDVKVDKNLTKSTEAILKPGYAPIEQYLAHGNLGPWTDVYAMCATIFFCLTGKVPPAAPERVLGDEELDLEKELPALTPKQRAALKHGLNIRAEARTASMEELHQELFDGNVGPTPLPSLLEVLMQMLKRWAPYALAAVLTVCAIVFGVQALNSGKEPPAPSLPTASPTQPTATPTATPTPTPTPTPVTNLISGKCGSLTWTLDQDTGELTVSGKGKMPDYYDQTPPPWQKHKDTIKSVRIESGVTRVGRAAFYRCVNLTSVDLPDTLEEIGEAAFNECTITELQLPDGLKNIEASAFSWSPLKTVVIPDSVKYVGLGAFSSNEKLQSVTIGPDTRLNYDTWNPIFSASPNLTIRGYTNSMAEDYARILGCKFEAIGTKAWDAEGQCGDNLNWYLDLKTGFLKIDGEGDMWDFNGVWMTGEHENLWEEDRELPPWSKYREKIYAVSIGDTVTSIGEHAFDNCDNMEDVHFGNSLKHIGSAFMATAIDQISLPENVTEIVPFAFNCCDKLTELRLPEGLKQLEENAIAECKNLRRLFVGKDTVINESHGLPFTYEEGGGNPTTYPNLTIISLPGSDAERFAREYNFPFKTGARGMVAEDEGQCGDNVYWFKSGENLVLYGTGSTWIYQVNDNERADWGKGWPESWLKSGYPGYYKYRNEIINLYLMPGVTGLQHRTITEFQNLEFIDFGTLQEARCAISGCISLKEVRLPETMVGVGEWMLAWNPNLRRVVIENGSTYVSEGLFEGCLALEEVWFSGKEYIGDNNLLNPQGGIAPNPIFYVKPGSDAERYAKEHGIRYEYYSSSISGKCGSLTWTLNTDTGEFTVSGKGKMPNYYNQTPPPWQKYKDTIKSVRIESGVTYVGRDAFCRCVNLTSVDLPDTLVEIGEGAFNECAITELQLPDGLKTIRDSAFCWSPLTTLVIPDSVTYVDSDAFNHNEILQSVTIGPDTRLTLDWPPIFGTQATIRGYTNSMAEDYARAQGCKFESIGTKAWDAEGQCGDKLNWYLDLKTGFLKIDGEGDMWDFNGTWMTGKHENLLEEDRQLPPWSKYRGKIYAVSIGDAVTSIGENAFECCDNLADVHFGNSLTRISFQAFFETAIDQIILPENVTDIEGFAFNWCRNLTEIWLPESLKVLEENAIAECGNLQRLFVGKNTVINESHGLPFTCEEEVENHTTYPNLTIVSLPGSDAERFAREYDIPFKTGARGMVAEDEGQCGDNVYWFKSNENLVLYGTGSTWLYDIDDEARADWALRDFRKSWLNYGHPEYYKYRDEIAHLFILPGVTALRHNTFHSFPNLEYIDFGTLKGAHFAIQQCPSLEEVHLPDTMTNIGEWMLSNNPNLRRVYIENGSRYVAEGVFGGCYALEEVWFSGKESIGDENLFDDGTGSGTATSKVTFYVKPGSDAECYAKEHGIRYEYY